MPRICFIAHGFNSVEREGPHQRAVRWLIPALADRGLEVDIVGTGVLSPDRDPTAEFSPARLITLGTGHLRFAIPAFRHYLAHEQPDICIGLVAGVNLFALLGRVGMQKQPAVIPWEATPLVYDLPSLSARERVMYPPLLRRLYPRAATLLGTSRDCIETLADLGVRIDGIPRAVVPYPMNVDEVAKLSRQEAPNLSMLGANHLIVAAGRLDPRKGHDVLLHAVADLHASGLDASVVILGEGPSREALESIIRSLGLSDHVLLPGHIRAPHRVYGRAAVFVHPSRWEGFGLSLLEAMAVGSPVIATTCPGGPKEILDGGRYGLLVPPDDALALASAIESLIRDERARLEMARQARLRADAYAPSKVADTLIQAISPYLN